MENVVKYDVYLDILLVGSIYVTKSAIVQGKPEIPVILQTPSSRLRHRYAASRVARVRRVDPAIEHDHLLSGSFTRKYELYVSFT